MVGEWVYCLKARMPGYVYVTGSFPSNCNWIGCVLRMDIDYLRVPDSI